MKHFFMPLLWDQIYFFCPGAIWISKEAQALLDEIKREKAEEGIGKPSNTDAVMRLGKNRKAKVH